VKRYPVRNAIILINFDSCFIMPLFAVSPVMLAAFYFSWMIPVRYFCFCLLAMRVYVGSSPGVMCFAQCWERSASHA
jgi:hypothetical protein